MEQGCHPCILSRSLDTIPSVELSIIRSVIRAFTEARPMACLSSDIPACHAERRHAFRHSCNPALCHSALPSGADACKQACVTDSAKKQVIPMHSFIAVVWGICWQCLVGSDRAMFWKKIGRAHV